MAANASRTVALCAGLILILPAAAQDLPAPAAADPAADAPALRLADAGGSADWSGGLVSLEMLGYRDGFALEGDRGSRSLFLPLPAGVDVAKAQLVFDVEFGELLIPASAVAFRVNGVPRRAVSRGTGSLNQRIEIPLAGADLERPFARVDLDYTLFLNQDTCFSRQIAGAYVRFAPGSGVAALARDPLPDTVRAAWSLLPPEVVVAAPLAQLTPAEFQALFALATALQREARRVRLVALPESGGAGDAHIVVAPAERFGEAAAGSANLRLVRSGSGTRPGRAFILVDSARGEAAVAMLQQPWRHAAGTAAIDIAEARAWPRPRQPDDTVTLAHLGFADSERSFTTQAEWHIALPWGPLGNAQRPSRAALDVYAPRLKSRGPTVVSAWYNDRLVFSEAMRGEGGRERFEFELPRVQLRARNNLRVVAQRDEAADDCKLVQAAFPLSISPTSLIETQPLNERPATFAELVPHQGQLRLYVGKDALAAADRVVPLLVGLGQHFWPDAAAPRVTLFEPGVELNPDGAFFVVGDPRWNPEAPVRFDQGRVRVRSAATGEPLTELDFAGDSGATVLQMTQASGQGGAWLRSGDGWRSAPSARLLFEDENVALLDPRGTGLALRVGAARDYRIDYPETRGWFDATGKWRTALFVLGWLVLAALLLILFRRRGPRA